MMDDSAPMHERKKLVETHKNVLPRKQTVAAVVCGEIYSNKKKRWSREMVTDVTKYKPCKIKKKKTLIDS